MTLCELFKCEESKAKIKKAAFSSKAYVYEVQRHWSRISTHCVLITKRLSAPKDLMSITLGKNCCMFFLTFFGGNSVILCRVTVLNLGPECGLCCAVLQECQSEVQSSKQP